MFLSKKVSPLFLANTVPGIKLVHRGNQRQRSLQGQQSNPASKSWLDILLTKAHEHTWVRRVVLHPYKVMTGDHAATLSRVLQVLQMKQHVEDIGATRTLSTLCTGSDVLLNSFYSQALCNSKKRHRQQIASEDLAAKVSDVAGHIVELPKALTDASWAFVELNARESEGAAGLTTNACHLQTVVHLGPYRHDWNQVWYAVAAELSTHLVFIATDFYNTLDAWATRSLKELDEHDHCCCRLDPHQVLAAEQIMYAQSNADDHLAEDVQKSTGADMQKCSEDAQGDLAHDECEDELPESEEETASFCSATSELAMFQSAEEDVPSSDSEQSFDIPEGEQSAQHSAAEVGQSRSDNKRCLQTLALIKASLETFLLAEGMMAGMPGPPQYVEVAEVNMHKNYEEELRKAVHRYATKAFADKQAARLTAAQAAQKRETQKKQSADMRTKVDQQKMTFRQTLVPGLRKYFRSDWDIVQDVLRQFRKASKHANVELPCLFQKWERAVARSNGGYLTGPVQDLDIMRTRVGIPDWLPHDRTCEYFWAETTLHREGPFQACCAWYCKSVALGIQMRHEEPQTITKVVDWWHRSLEDSHYRMKLQAPLIREFKKCTTMQQWESWAIATAQPFPLQPNERKKMFLRARDMLIIRSDPRGTTERRCATTTCADPPLGVLYGSGFWVEEVHQSSHASGHHVPNGDVHLSANEATLTFQTCEWTPPGLADHPRMWMPQPLRPSWQMPKCSSPWSSWTLLEVEQCIVDSLNSPDLPSADLEDSSCCRPYCILCCVLATLRPEMDNTDVNMGDMLCQEVSDTDGADEYD